VYFFNRNFQAVSFSQVSFTQITPSAGWCEHDPLEIWLTVRECMVKALQEAESKLGPIDVKAIGITNQRETTVVWHKVTGLPLYNGIVWMDIRTRDLCKQFEEDLGSKEYFRAVTGLPISTYFSAFKFKWLYENVEAVKKAVDEDMACFGTMDSWLIYQLTGGAGKGVHVTDVSNASRTMLMNLATCQWHEPYLPLFNMTAAALPKIVSNAEVYGYVDEGMLAGAPISGCLGDQMAAMLGQSCAPGEAKNTYGTGCFMLLNTGPSLVASHHGLLTTVSYKLGPDAVTQYALEGAVAIAGMGISWLRDNLRMVESPEEASDLAASVPDTGGVYFVPAFSGLLAPRWDDSARGTIVGLTGFSNRAHIARAMFEAICFQTKEVLEAMRKDVDKEGCLLVLRVDGGAARNDLLMQMQADLLQVSVQRPHFQETTALGAALAAGLGVGFWNEEQVMTWQAYNTTEFKPQITNEDAEHRYSHWNKAVARSYDLADLAT
jgi:glycerol kinase